MSSNRYKIVFCTPALYTADDIDGVVDIITNYFTVYMDYDIIVIVIEERGNNRFVPISSHVNRVNCKLGIKELWKIASMTYSLLFVIDIILVF